MPRSFTSAWMVRCDECFDAIRRLVTDMPGVEGFMYPNEIELQWSVLIVLYPFLTGLVAGAIILAAAQHVRDGHVRLASGMLSDKFGRKRLLVLSAFLFTVSSIGTGLAGTFAVFLAWRISGGVAIGLASSLSPMYIAEVAPERMRGRLVSMNQLTIVIGLLTAQVVNWLLARPVPAGATAAQILQSWNGQQGWRWMFGVTAIPSLLFLVSMFFVPESPRWLAKNGQRKRAQAVLARIGGKLFAGREPVPAQRSA